MVMMLIRGSSGAHRSLVSGSKNYVRVPIEAPPSSVRNGPRASRCTRALQFANALDQGTPAGGPLYLVPAALTSIVQSGHLEQDELALLERAEPRIGGYDLLVR